MIYYFVRATKPTSTGIIRQTNLYPTREAVIPLCHGTDEIHEIDLPDPESDEHIAWREKREAAKLFSTGHVYNMRVFMDGWDFAYPEPK